MILGGEAQWTALLLTLLLEIPIVVVAVRWRASNYASWRAAAVGAAATCLTHPLVWFMILRGLQGVPYMARLAVMELFAVVVEGIIYARFLPMRAREAFVLSLVANGISCGVGMLL